MRRPLRRSFDRLGLSAAVASATLSASPFAVSEAAFATGSSNAAGRRWNGTIDVRLAAWRHFATPHDRSTA